MIPFVTSCGVLNHLSGYRMPNASDKVNVFPTANTEHEQQLSASVSNEIEENISFTSSLALRGSPLSPFG